MWLRLPNKNHLLLIYKLLHDLLFIELFFFLSILLGEAALPGIITKHIGFSQIIFIFALTLLAIYLIANLATINIQNTKINKKTTLPLFIFSSFIIFASLWKAGIIVNLLILGFILTTGYYLYKVILEEE